MFWYMMRKYFCHALVSQSFYCSLGFSVIVGFFVLWCGFWIKAGIEFSFDKLPLFPLSYATDLLHHVVSYIGVPCV